MEDKKYIYAVEDVFVVMNFTIDEEGEYEYLMKMSVYSHSKFMYDLFPLSE